MLKWFKNLFKKKENIPPATDPYFYEVKFLPSENAEEERNRYLIGSAGGLPLNKVTVTEYYPPDPKPKKKKKTAKKKKSKKKGKKK